MNFIMNSPRQTLFEAPLPHLARSGPDVPDRLIALQGSQAPVRVAWQPPKRLDVFAPSIGDNIVASGQKGVYIIYKNGQAIYAGAGGVDPHRPGGDIRKELRAHARTLYHGADSTDVFTVRVGIVTNPTPARVKTVENLTIRRLNTQLAANKKRRLRNTKDITEFRVRQNTSIVHRGGRNIPGAMRTRPGTGAVARQRLRTKIGKRRATYEAETGWLFEAPLAHQLS